MNKQNPVEQRRSPEIPEDKYLAKNQFQSLLNFLQDPVNKEITLYAKNLDSRSVHYNKPYIIYLGKSGIECKSFNKPPHTVELNPRIMKTNFLYLTEETFKILQRYQEEQAKKKISETGKVIKHRIEDLY